MLFVAIAAFICIAGIVSYSLQLKSEGLQGVRRSPRFWIGVAGLLATAILFYLMDTKQRRTDIENAVAAERQAGEIEKVKSKSDEIKSKSEEIMNSGKREYEEQALRHRAQLEQAKSLGKLQEEQKESLQDVIDSQALNIQLLNTLSLNRNLTGIQLSFTPSRDHWTRIAALYSRTTSPFRDVPYVNAPMMAERIGEHWQLEFEPVYIKPRVDMTPRGPIKVGGYMKLEKLSTAKPENKVFEQVLNEVALGLRIEWGNGTYSVIEPREGTYPSAMYVSRDKIGLIFRPPFVLWNLNQLQRNAKVTFHGRDYPSPSPLPGSFTLCSLDPGVLLNQTIQLNWIKRNEDSYEARMNPQRSGPHELTVGFNFFGPTEKSQPHMRVNTGC